MENNGSNLYMLVDSGNIPVARGVLENSPSSSKLEIRVTDNNINKVMQHELLQLIGMDPDTKPILGRIIKNKGDTVVLKKQQVLGEDVRQNLRIGVMFDSFIYPVTGKWRGRYKVVSYDISCGGIAFYCDEVLKDGECVEVVIPITEQPLILKCKILRSRRSIQGSILYSGQFVDTCHDEEAEVRKIVFSTQLEQQKSRASRAAR